MSTAEPWSHRLHQGLSTLTWCCALNAMWWLFTLLGGVVLGAGPATVTACVVARRRMRGEPVRLRDFASTWRRELLRGNVVMTPLFALILVLLSNYAFFSALGSGASVPRLATLAALTLTVTVTGYLGPMYAHYDLPLRAYLGSSLRFALARPVPTVVLLFAFATIAFVTAVQPVLLLTVSIGVWLQTSTWLCVRFFEENEHRLAEEAVSGPHPPVRVLPSEPLRIR